MYGKDWSDGNAGGFKLCVANGTEASVKRLEGYPNGTLTWDFEKILTERELGYRRANIYYAVGDSAYHLNLPTNWYLECITAGMTSNSTLTINNPTDGSTITDGTVVWKIRNLVTLLYNITSPNQILNSMLNSQSSNNGYTLSTYIVFGSLFNNFKIQLIYDNAATLNEREVVFPIAFTNYPNLAIGYNNFDNHVLSKLNVYTKTFNSCVYIKDIQDIGVHITAMQF